MASFTNCVLRESSLSSTHLAYVHPNSVSIATGEQRRHGGGCPASMHTLVLRIVLTIQK